MDRLGLTLPLQHLFPPLVLLDVARRAEAAGYDSVWVPEVTGPDAYSVMTAIVLRTERITVASGVIPVQIRSPVVHAFSAATVDALAPGRVILGIGTSSPIIVGQWHGLPYERPLRQMREAVAIIRQVLAGPGQKTAFEGEIYSSKGFRMPLFPSRIPVYLGALNPGMLRLAGEIADWALFNWVPAAAIPAMVEHVRKGAADAGRDPDEVDVACYVRTCVTDDPAPTFEHLRRELTSYTAVPTYHRQFVHSGFAGEARAAAERWRAGDRKGAVGEMSDRLVDSINAIGSAAECRAKVQAFRDAGVRHLIVAPWSGAQDPMPEVAATLDAFAPASA